MLPNLDKLVPQLKSVFDRQELRLTANLPGRYAITERRSKVIERLPVFTCHLCSISPHGAAVKAPVLGFEGERVSVYFNAFGILPAQVSRSTPDGFEMVFDLSQEDQERLAAKIIWHKRLNEGGLTDARRFERVVPENATSTVTLPSGEQERCTVADISCSGAAVLASFRPGIGTPVALGRLIGRVVRHTEKGFALQFLKIQPADRLEEMLRPPKGSKGQGPGARG
ncbi:MULTISPECIES: PilZ domain-containing protein [unclassified Devosia]|uniref:PilZ domain-containing protein n=1 Tax=unclassified Devosia TaxID=196773 RepID=UPI001554B295